MRYSYGILDRKRVLAYRPQLFRRTDDLLAFPSKEFARWYSGINEIMDGIYQINAIKIEKGKLLDVSDLNLVMGLLVNINEEMEGLFDQDKKVDFSYYYISTMDDEFKKRQSNFYGRYMHKIDRKMIEITPQMRYKHMMEIVDYAHKLWAQEDRATRLNLIEKRKKEI